jgi:hypothetical protein
MQFDEEKELIEEVLPEQQETSTENIREEFTEENSDEPQKKYQNRYQDKYKRIRDEYKEEQSRFQSEKNKLLEELEKRNQEIETWKNYANQSINASAFHYHTSAEQRLKAAEERLDMARRDGDFQTEKLAIKEMVDAQTDIREARKIRNDIDSYNSNNSNYDQNQNQQKYNNIPQNPTNTNTKDLYSPEVEYRATKWIERNPEINPQSPYYNQKIEGAIKKAAEDLTGYFHQQGRPDLVGSVQYFNYLEEYKEKLEENKLQNRMQKDNQDYAHFAPVKGTQTQNVEYSRTMSSDLRKKLEAAAEASEMPFDTYLKMYQESQKDIKTLSQQGK